MSNWDEEINHQTMAYMSIWDEELNHQTMTYMSNWDENTIEITNNGGVSNANQFKLM